MKTTLYFDIESSEIITTTQLEAEFKRMKAENPDEYPYSFPEFVNDCLTINNGSLYPVNVNAESGKLFISYGTRNPVTSWEITAEVNKLYRGSAANNAVLDIAESVIFDQGVNLAKFDGEKADFIKEVEPRIPFKSIKEQIESAIISVAKDYNLLT